MPDLTQQKLHDETIAFINVLLNAKYQYNKSTLPRDINNITITLQFPRMHKHM